MVMEKKTDIAELVQNFKETVASLAGTFQPSSNSYNNGYANKFENSRINSLYTIRIGVYYNLMIIISK